MNTLENQTAKTLIKKKLSLSIAESCTGGLISHRLTNIPGSSKYFKLAVVAYSNEVKNSILRVPKALIKRKGAVSKEVAIRLAKGILKLSNTDLALGITGIAGPTGGTKAKPVGLVFIAIVSSKNKIICKKFNFTCLPTGKKGNRLSIKKQSCDIALKLLNAFIKKHYARISTD